MPTKIGVTEWYPVYYAPTEDWQVEETVNIPSDLWQDYLRAKDLMKAMLDKIHKIVEETL